MTQEKIDVDLDSLVAFLKARGTETSLPTIRRLTEEGVAIAARLKANPATVDKMLTTQKITDADRRDMLYFRQAGALASAVEELKTWLGLLDRLYHPQTLDYRLHVLFEALASAAVLARRCIDDELADQLLYREHERAGAAKAREGVSDKTQPRDKLILDLARELRFMETGKEKKRCGGIARLVFEDKRLTDSEEWKAKPMGLGGVDAVVRKHWSRLSPSLPKRAKPR